MQNGGARPGAGRKRKADEIKLIETIDNALGESWVDGVLIAVHKKAQAGSIKHAELLLAYRFGKPSEKFDITSGGKEIKQITGVVVK